MAVGTSSLISDLSYVEKFKCDANDATFIKLVRSEGDVISEDGYFHPWMSHQLYGDSEIIFGYRGLKIKLLYHSGSLLTYLGMDYDEKVSPSAGIVPDSVLKNIAANIPDGYYSNLDEFIKRLPDEDNFVPMGEKIHSYIVDDKEYEVYHGTIVAPRLKDYHKRLQTFILWYIDAASFIDDDDEKWNFFFLFEKKKGPMMSLYSLVGYVTVYHYFSYPSKFRPRISQMLILPPFQRHGHGAKLIAAVSNHYVLDANASDISVEDPSEEFIRCRDYIDCKNCMQLDTFDKEYLINGYSSAMEDVALKKLKISKRQSRRVYEILRLRVTDSKNSETMRAYRLDVKNRLNIPFKKQARDMAKLQAKLSPSQYNFAAAGQSLEENVQRLEDHYKILEEEYKRVVTRLESDR